MKRFGKCVGRGTHHGSIGSHLSERRHRDIMNPVVHAITNVLVALLLVGPPVLCRAGVLVGCCDHDSTGLIEAGASALSPCCAGCDTPGEPPQPLPDRAPRKCGTCAGVCGTLVKPSDDSNAMMFATWMVMTIQTFCETTLASGSYIQARPIYQLASLPFPPSDLPLLI